MSSEAVLEALLRKDFKTVLDIGSGSGVHADVLRAAGKQVTTLDIKPPADIIGDYMSLLIDEQFDCVWCSHVLEHQLNVHNFLVKVKGNLKEGGWLALTVPPRKDPLVGGHLTLWTPALLIYNLVMAGFDCSKAYVNAYGYNISVLVQKKPLDVLNLHRGLKFDRGDIETLSDYFPVQVKQKANPWLETGW